MNRPSEPVSPKMPPPAFAQTQIAPRLGLPLSAPDTALVPVLQAAIDDKTKPLGALGQLEALALHVGLIQQTLRPCVEPAHILVFAADHGAARAGISAFPQEVTWQMVHNFLQGGAAINVFARQYGLGLDVVDAGVCHDFEAHPRLMDRKVALGTQNYLDAPAMTAQECETALLAGHALAVALAKEGKRCLILGEMGIGNTASASLITHALTGTALAEVVGRGTGLDDAGLARKREALAKAIARGGVPSDPFTLACEYGGFEIVMMAGAMLGAAQHRMVILVDGFIAGAALLLAHAMAPEVRHYTVFGHASAEPGHKAQLRFLRATPLLDLGLRLGEGTGATLAFGLVKSACAFLTEMASFAQAQVRSH
jgi:nicotinate-nucleotide--dimethylbenzimidazole phosphoribosyltransferase